LTFAARRTRTRAILLAAASALAVAGLGALSTDLGVWYAGLREPDWKPPDILFGPAWMLIYTCTTAAGVLAWTALRAGAGRGTGSSAGEPSRRKERDTLLAAFALNAVLNVVWSLLFFRLHRPDWALAEVGALWLSIVLLIVLVAPRSRPAAWLLLPYLLWVAFAAALNLAVVRLNPPFGSA
jgi:tryptophan-rich sensory protein